VREAARNATPNMNLSGRAFGTVVPGNYGARSAHRRSRTNHRPLREVRQATGLLQGCPGAPAMWRHAMIRGNMEGRMQSAWIAILGTVGTVLSTFSMMPQVWRTWRTRSAADISASWLVIALASMVIWIGYAFLIDAPAIVLVNVLGFIQSGSILFIKMRSRPAALQSR
jgi:MtN3 and saliva related transmembrane protein